MVAGQYVVVFLRIASVQDCKPNAYRDVTEMKGVKGPVANWGAMLRAAGS